MIMSHLSNMLTTALGELGWSQTYLSELSGIQRTQINRYARGVSSMDADGLEKILKVFPVPFNSRILAAYLRDAMPPGAEGLVALEERVETVQEMPPELPSGLDPDLRASIIRIALLARRHTEIRDIVFSLERLMRSKG